ncbi:hypothetical protein ABW20_dc0104601 [Dactylellina cionopaga]|nr:hypothetical protein ABW20_dc0104601 [Dactylellina cionopaga]
MKVIITGATGYFGGEVLRQCVASNQITSIIALVRRDLKPELQNEKVTSIKVEDFGEFSDETLEKMKGAEGTTPNNRAGMTMEQLKIVNEVWPTKAAEAFSKLPEGKKFRFIYTSGFLVPGPEILDKKLWFAEEFRKGRAYTERNLLDLAKEGKIEAVITKPAFITNGEPLLGRLLGGTMSVSKEAMAACYLDAVFNGCDKQVLSNGDLKIRGAAALEKFASKE